MSKKKVHTPRDTLGFLPDVLGCGALATVLADELTSSKLAYALAEETASAAELTLVDGSSLSGDLTAARFLWWRKFDSASTFERCEVDQWLQFFGARFPATYAFAVINAHLAARTYLVGETMGLADIAALAFVGAATEIDAAKLPHLARWNTQINATRAIKMGLGKFKSENARLKRERDNRRRAAELAAEDAKTAAAGGDAVQRGSSSGGTMPELVGAVLGEVVTRFPPEPSGYMHIGHVKAAMLNFEYAKLYKGKMILRFDDTNPQKEKAEFVTNMLHDLESLSIVPDIITYTSDSFPLITTYALRMIKEGKAYMDDTPQELMREEREQRKNSVHRDETPEVNLTRFKEMCTGSDAGKLWCLRAKADMQSDNGCMRDFVCFRCPTVAVSHHRTGTKYKAYPTYDFACPIVDSVEGVTHAMRTTEYNDRLEQFHWVQEQLQLRKVTVQEFARLGFEYTVMSKRKLAKFVEIGEVEGWNDPRFPTVQGALRRGVLVEALRKFILDQGFSRRIVTMEWDKFWSQNAKIMDKTASRFFAVGAESGVPLVLANFPEAEEGSGLQVQLHPKDPSLGYKVMTTGSQLLVEREDAAQFVVGEEVTLMRWGNAVITSITKDGDGVITGAAGEYRPKGDPRKTKQKLTWLSRHEDGAHLVPCTIVEFDHIIDKARLAKGEDPFDFLTTRNHPTRVDTASWAESATRQLQKNAIIQIERRGYFRVDSPYISPTSPMVLFMIPDGKKKAMSTLSSSLEHR
jgi:glutamyl-tRNA synthetase